MRRRRQARRMCCRASPTWSITLVLLPLCNHLVMEDHAGLLCLHLALVVTEQGRRRRRRSEIAGDHGREDMYNPEEEGVGVNK